MSWWNEAKKALGVASGSAEEQDRYPRAAALAADGMMQALTRRAVDRFEHADDAEVVRILRRPGDAATPPASGAERRNWIRDQIESSFRHPDASARYDTTGAIDDAVARKTRSPDWIEGFLENNVHEAVEHLALSLASHYAAMHAPALQTMRRIEDEVAALRSWGRQDLVDRFSQTPPARIDPCPEQEPARTRWLRDMLLGEHAIIRSGAVPADRVVSAAGRIAVDVPIRDLDPSGPMRIDRPADDDAVWSRLQTQANHLATYDEEALIRRFGALPGVATRTAIPPKDIQARQTWIRRALSAEHVRRLTGLDQDENPDRSTPLAIDVEDVSIVHIGEEGMEFDAALLVDGMRICDVASRRDGGLEALNWAQGCDDVDLAALESYIAATGRPRVRSDGRERPDTLADRVYDQVALHAATLAYRIAAEHAVLFIPDPAAADMTLLRVDVPEGGDRDEARAHARTAHPAAVFLDDLAEADAVEAWTALS